MICDMKASPAFSRRAGIFRTSVLCQAIAAGPACSAMRTFASAMTSMPAGSGGRCDGQARCSTALGTPPAYEGTAMQKLGGGYGRVWESRVSRARSRDIKTPTASGKARNGGRAARDLIGWEEVLVGVYADLILPPARSRGDKPAIRELRDVTKLLSEAASFLRKIRAARPRKGDSGIPARNIAPTIFRFISSLMITFGHWRILQV